MTNWTRGFIPDDASSLSGLSDVALASPSDGQALKYNASAGKWENSTDATGGDVTGPASSKDNALARYDGLGGKTLQDSNVIITDNGDIRPLGDNSQMIGSSASAWSEVWGVHLYARDTSSGNTTTPIRLRNVSTDNDTGLRISFQLSTANSAQGFLEFIRTNSGGSQRTKATIAVHDGNALVSAATFTEDAGIIHGGAVYQQLRQFTVSGNCVVSARDHTIIINKAFSEATTVTLPNVPLNGRELIFKDGAGTASTQNITLSPSSGTIDGAASYVMNVNRQATKVVWSTAASAWSVL